MHLERDAAVPIPRDQTTQRMHTDQVTLNVPVEDELDCKLDLAEDTADKMEYRKEMKDWAENSAWIYHLVLLHYPPGLILELQNQSRWIDGKALKDCIALLRDAL